MLKHGARFSEWTGLTKKSESKLSHFKALGRGNELPHGSPRRTRLCRSTDPQKARVGHPRKSAERSEVRSRKRPLREIARLNVGAPTP
jgi:hypothetical protein